MATPSDSHLLREIDVLRACLADCLQRLDDVERHLDVAPADSVDAPTPAAANTDPFEWALPARGGDGATVRLPQPAAPRRSETPDAFTIRAVPLPDHLAPETRPSRPETTEAATETLHDAAGDVQRSRGNGSPDPFAFVHVPLIAPNTEEGSEMYRGMDALLGGLDVTAPDRAA